MKTKILISLLILLMLFTAIFFNGDKTKEIKNNNNEPPIIEVSEIKDISLEIKEGTLTKTGATIVITDLTGNTNLYGDWFRIDKKENGTWKTLKVKDKNSVFSAVGYIVDTNNKLEIKQNWEKLYGILSSGKYRLLKKIAISNGDSYIDKYILVEFNID